MHGQKNIKIWQLVSYVLGQSVGPVFKGQVVKEEVCITVCFHMILVTCCFKNIKAEASNLLAC